MSVTKRPRLSGEFNPVFPPTPSPTSPSSNNVMNDATMLENTPERHMIKTEEAEQGVLEERKPQAHDEPAIADVEMSDPPKPDWHLAEPTAHPDVISQYINSDTLPPYLLRSTTRVIGRPHPSEDFIKLFKLDDIAKSVRRVDPNTGEKINKIRKSYEGKIKELKVAGRNKAISSPGEWVPKITEYPEEDWHATFVLGKEISKSTGADFQEKLVRALDILPGSLPKSELARWKNLLGVEETLPQAVPAGKSRTNVPQAPEQPASQNASLGVERPDRQNKKRKYTDSSFAGYEGYGDDDDSDDDGTKKKRKKSFPANPPAHYSIGIATRDS